MGIKKVVARNVIWNWAGMATNLVVSFLTAPFLVHRLGETSYGVWILIGSFTGYFGLLDLGVRGSVGRQISFLRERGDVEGSNAVLSLSAAFLVAAGALALLATLCLTLVFTRIFEVPAGEVAAARWALALVGLNLALWLPLNVFDATLWGFQRFDLINAIDITSVATRTALILVLIGNGYGLVALALITLLTMSGGQALKAVACVWVEPGLRVSPGRIRRGVARELFGYSTWYFLIGVAQMVTKQLGPLVVGLRLGVSFVTPYSVASRLVSYAGEVVVACTGVLTPVATALHARESRDGQRALFAEGGKACLALTLFLVVTFLVLGRALITLWMGPALVPSARLLSILALGEALPMSQWVTYSVILGMGRHRVLSFAFLGEALAAAVLAGALSKGFGLEGVCLGFAIPAALGRGVFQFLYGCRLVEVSPWRHLGHDVLPVVAAAALPALALAAAVARNPPGSLPAFVAYAGLYALGHFAACAATQPWSRSLFVKGAAAMAFPTPQGPPK